MFWSPWEGREAVDLVGQAMSRPSFQFSLTINWSCPHHNFHQLNRSRYQLVIYGTIMGLINKSVSLQYQSRGKTDKSIHCQNNYGITYSIYSLEILVNYGEISMDMMFASPYFQWYPLHMTNDIDW
jgi:hypothetical protein